MSASAILQEAARLGVALRVQGDQLVARPRQALTTTLVESIRLHRAGVLALLKQAVPPPSAPCWSCRSHRYFARPERLTWTCARCHPPAVPTEMVWHDVATEVRDG